MSLRTRSVVAAATALSVLAVPASAQGPAAIGTWYGKDRSGDTTVRVRYVINRLVPGQRSGTSRYRVRGHGACRGRLRLRRVVPGAYVFTDRLVSGGENCTNGDRVTMRPAGDVMRVTVRVRGGGTFSFAVRRG